jgi:hypothetical protein
VGTEWKMTYEWKSATMALSPAGMGMNSWPAPLMMVRGTYDFDTRTTVNIFFDQTSRQRCFRLLFDDV